MGNPEFFYLCDPEKNKTCTKISCHLNGEDYPCRLAVKKEHAVTDEKGRPLGYTWEQFKNLPWRYEEWPEPKPLT